MIWFLWQCFKAYRSVAKGQQDVLYATATHAGVPEFTLLLGYGRSAWRVSQFAAEFFAAEMPKPQ